MSKPTREFCKKQILRMAQMDRFPMVAEAQGELIDALMKDSTEEIARAVVSEFMEEADRDTRCPMPAEIRRAVQKRLDDFRPDPDCGKCRGAGFIITDSQEWLTGAAKCNCWQRRPEPVYKRGSDADDLKQAVEALAAAKTKRGPVGPKEAA